MSRPFECAVGRQAIMIRRTPHARGMPPAAVSGATTEASSAFEELTELPTLGAIPVMHNFADRRRQFRIGAWSAAAYAIALIIVSITVARAAEGHLP